MLHQQHTNNIIELRSKLSRRFNIFITNALTPFIQGKLDEIAEHGNEIALSSNAIKELQNSYIEEINKIDFLNSYARRDTSNVQHAHHDLKPLYRGSSEIHHKSIEPFLMVANPKLIDTTDFVYRHQEVNNKLKTSQSVSKYLRDIKCAINLYSGSNKKHIINNFNKRWFALQMHVEKNWHCISQADIVQQVIRTLECLQNSESNYYNGRFFSAKRKAGSTLQIKINAARKIAENMLPTEVNHCPAVR